jgi:4-hydroxy-tetrahydrodipicolinate synthase
MKKLRLTGVIPALVTPFKTNGSVDTDGLKRNIGELIACGIQTFMCNGCSGEGIALDSKERLSVVETALKAVSGKGKLIASAGVATTRETIALVRDVKEAGADAAMVITPFMEIPSQEGIYRHFEAVASAVDIPLVLYNIPPHTTVNIELDTLGRLAEIDNVVALKDSSGNLSYAAASIQKYGEKLSILTGGDDILVPAFTLGAAGAILAIANAAPKMVMDIFNAIRAQQLEKAKELYYSLLPLAQAIGSPVNFPAPLKEALNLLGKAAGRPRLPSVPVCAEESAAIRDALRFAGLL